MARFYSVSRNDVISVFTPIYDGEYVDEDGSTHRTWITESDCGEMLYVLDYSAKNGIICTCQGGDFKKSCKHIGDLFRGSTNNSTISA